MDTRLVGIYPIIYRINWHSYPKSILMSLECHHIDKLAEKLEQHKIDACLTIADPLIQSPAIYFQPIYTLPKSLKLLFILIDI